MSPKYQWVSWLIILLSLSRTKENFQPFFFQNFFKEFLSYTCKYEWNFPSKANLPLRDKWQVYDEHICILESLSHLNSFLSQFLFKRCMLYLTINKLTSISSKLNKFPSWKKLVNFIVFRVKRYKNMDKKIKHEFKNNHNSKHY